ncbi:hypothetical protein K4H02_23180, partial [Mycobacterium tuberculosis]|nr:hypothetical protein [Mycobacterium tuberculosis]
MAPKCGARSSWRLINDVVSEALRDVTLAQILPPLPLADDEQRRTIAVDVVSGAVGGPPRPPKPSTTSPTATPPTARST